MFRKKTFSFSKRRSAGSPPPDTKDADTGRERAHSESNSSFARSNERKSFRKLKDFIGGHKDKTNKKQELKSTISNPIPVNVKRYGVDNTDYITGLPLQPKDQVKRVGVEEEINVFYNSLPRPKKSTPEQVAIISGRTGSFSCGTFSRSGSIRSTATYQTSTLQRPQMHPRRKVPPIPLESKHNSVSSEESGVSVSYECEDSQRLEKSKWFHGIVKPTLADKALKKHGDFLVRENISGTPLYYASVMWSDAIHHIPIKMVEMFPGGGRTIYKYSFDEGAFDSVPQLVHAHMKYKIPVEQFSGILLVNPINKGSHYEDIDNADQDKNILEKERVPDDEQNSNSSTNLPEMKSVEKYPVPSNVLLDRDVRSQSVPTPIANSTAIKSPEQHPDSSSQPSLSKVRSSILVEDEEDDTYMEMSSVKSFHECPPDYRCGSSSPRRGTSFSATPEPMYAKSSPPSFHSSATEISRTRTPNYSPYSVSKRNRSGLLSHTQSPPIAEPPIKYDMTSTAARSGKGLLDDPSVQAIVGKVLETSTDQLAFHTTLTDAVNFKLLPHPGESEESWWKRMKEEGSMRGLLAGLEVLGSPQGEHLWNSLWSRHHTISQWVVLCVTSMESLKTRTKLLSKFIDLARVLQGTKYSNVFGFMAVMDGLNTVQIAGLKKTWEALQTEYPDLYQSYTNQLIDVYTQVHQGEKVFALEYVTVPSIQQLGETFLPKVDTFNPKHYHNGDVKDLMAGLDHFAQGFVQLREMLQHCPTFHWNARKKLSGVAINSDLYTYLMRDHPRDLLHQLKLEKNLDNSHQRRRMFNHILEILSDAAEPKQLSVSST